MVIQLINITHMIFDFISQKLSQKINNLIRELLE
jgi:hypothetical protein